MDLSQLSDEELLRAAGPISVRNNNPGNLRPVGANKGFQGFGTPQEGLQAMRDDLTAKVTGKSRAMNGAQPTLSNLLNVYAPPSENDTARYIGNVAQATGLNPNQPLTPQDVDKLIPAMIKQEGGDMASQYYSKFTPTAETSAQIDYTSMSDDELMKAAGIEAPSLPTIAPVPEQSGFAKRMADDFARRKGQIAGLADQAIAGKISETEALGRSGLKMAQMLPDTALNVISTVTPDFIEKPFKDLVGYGASSLADTRAGRATIGAVNDFNQQYPVTAGRIGSAVDVVNLALPFKKIGGQSVITASTKAADAVIDKTGQVAGKAITRGAEKLAVPKQVMPNSDQLAEMGVKAYDAARASGEVFDAGSVTNKFIDAIEKAKPRKIAGAVETDLSQALESNLGKYRQLMDKKLGIDEIDIIDKDLSNLKDQAYNAGKNQLGSELSNIQNALRGSVAESASGKTLSEARDFFRRKYQMEDVERIFRNAEGRPNEAAIIQTGYRNLANQARKKGSGYTKEQIAIMDKAAKGGLSIDALKLASSKLIPIVAGASGGTVGAGVAYMGNLAAGAGATALQTAKANRLAKSITKGITVQAEPTRLNRAAAKLTKQDLQKAFEAKKGTK